MKKIKIILIGFVCSVLFLASPAFASMTFTPTSPLAFPNDYTSITCTTGDAIYFYYLDNHEIAGGLNCGADATGFNFLTAFPSPHNHAPYSLIAIESDSTALGSDGDNYDTYATALTDTGYVTQTTFGWTYTTPTTHGIAILGGTAPSIGTPFDGTALKSGLTASVGSTMDGIGPVLAIVIGIILAMIVILKLLSLWGQAGDTATSEFKGSLVRKGKGFWIRE